MRKKIYFMMLFSFFSLNPTLGYSIQNNDIGNSSSAGYNESSAYLFENDLSPADSYWNEMHNSSLFPDYEDPYYPGSVQRAPPVEGGEGVGIAPIQGNEISIFFILALIYTGVTFYRTNKLKRN